MPAAGASCQHSAAPRRPVYIHAAGVTSTLGFGPGQQARGLADAPPAPQDVTLDHSGAPHRFPLHRLADTACDPLAACVTDALEAAGLEPDERRRCGVFLGSTCSNLAADERAYRERLHEPGAYALDLAGGHGDLTAQLAREHGLGGPQFFFGTACSSSANALLYAARMIERGDMDTALVVGTEHCNLLSLYGFVALELLAAGRARPFDRARDGLVLGEGVAALVLSHAPSPWRVRGGATRVDGHSPTGSSAHAIGRVISEALATAEVTPDRITAIKAHGTATPLNDQAESAALQGVFECLPPTASLKGALGHTLGGCGAVETAAIMACVEQGFWPASAGFAHPDTDPAGIAPLTQPWPADQGCFLLDFFGFGGNNCAYVIERRDDHQH